MTARTPGQEPAGDEREPDSAREASEHLPISRDPDDPEEFAPDDEPTPAGETDGPWREERGGDTHVPPVISSDD